MLSRIPAFELQALLVRIITIRIVINGCCVLDDPEDDAVCYSL
jgi:hypothetical protein